ncbi:uncharacterized protein LOC143547380 [Bidens hawaiensis]|uniref:uncharacterized protein LOC143547380 n=1 Tax=Bidens hawaiensis TaxID=980011 RepID=UPI00404B7170
MKSKTRLDSAVFQLTPTRTRCDLYIIANGGNQKEKIASGLLNPFIAHLKTAQDQIAAGGYSVFLKPQPATNPTWFTKSTLQSFVRFVSTPDILERVYTIESEILQIQEAIAIQGNHNISIKQDQYVKPVASNEDNKPAGDVDGEDKAIVLYKPGAHELPSPSAKERNSKVQLINVLETRKTVLKKEQGMAFARAVAAGFEIEQVANLLSFAECFGASRLMNGCLRFMYLWKQKHESGQWIEIEAEETLSDCSASGIVLSSMTSEPRASETAGSNTITAGGEQLYHPGFPPWSVHSSPQGQGGVPVYQAYPMPYYPGFYPPPPPYPSSSPNEDPSYFHKRQSMDNYNINRSEEESPEHRKSSGKKKSGRVVIRNINFINSKNETSSESASSDTDTGDHTQQRKRNLRSPKRKGNRKDSESETLNGKEADGGHWDAFQTYLLKSAEEGDHEDMFAMERDSKAKRRQKTMSDDDPLLAHGKDNDEGEGRYMQSYDASGRKIVHRSSTGDDFMMVGRREEMNMRDANGFEEVNLDKSNGLQYDEAAMVSLRSTSGVNDYNIKKGLKMFDLSENKSNKPAHVVKYEPDPLSLMPERDVENSGYDPAIDYEMQLAANASNERTSKQDKKGSKSAAEKHQLSKPNQSVARKGRPLKVNNNNKSTLEDARARADKLRSYKAELQKMKKEQQDAEQKRLEALKMERQKRILARTTTPSRKQLPSPTSSSSKPLPISHIRGSTKFTDSEPGSSSLLQRSKIRPSINGSKKPSTSSKLTDRMTRSLSSMSDTKKDLSSVADSHKASSSMTRVRRLSEPKKINTTHTTKTRSAESVSKPKSSTGPTETKKNEPNTISQKVKVMVDTSSEVGKVNLNSRLSEGKDSPVIDMTVMVEDNKQPTTKEVNSNHRTEVNIQEAPTVDKGTISVHPQKHPTTSSEDEVGRKYEAPYARISSFEDQSTRNSEYAKAVPHHQAFSGNGTTAAYVVSNLKMEKIPEKPQSKGGFRRLIKLGKKTHTASVQPPPQVDTLKSLISEDDHAQKASKRLFSFPFRGEKKPTGFGS